MTVIRRGLLSQRITALAFIAGSLQMTSILYAGPRDQAKRMFDRLTGVAPTAAILDQMEALIKNNDAEGAARVAIEHPLFYNVGLKGWFKPWTNTDESADVPLNDFVATMIGAVRDDISFDRVLYDDIIYVGTGVTGLPVYNPANNTHYQTLETQRNDLKAVLTQQKQSTVTGIAETAGVITTRGFGDAYFDMGTNRRPIKFILKNFLCQELEQVHDTTRPDFRIRQDVERNPGGDSTVFRNKCAGCHAGMDGLASAFAHFDYRGDRVVYEPNIVEPKYFINSNFFPNGFVTPDDSWINLWAEGQNARLGWVGEPSGSGPTSLGQYLSQTAAFSQCMADRVFTKVCLHKPTTSSELESVKGLASQFKDGGKYSMKSLFAQTAVVCMGE